MGQYPDERRRVVVLLPGVKYKIQTLTGRYLFAGCTSVVALKICGEKGETETWDLNASKVVDGYHVEKFEANQEDEFFIVDRDVGRIIDCYLYIKEYNLSKNSKWFLENLNVQSCRCLKNNDEDWIVEKQWPVNKWLKCGTYKF